MVAFDRLDWVIAFLTGLGYGRMCDPQFVRDGRRKLAKLLHNERRSEYEERKRRVFAYREPQN